MTARPDYLEAPRPGFADELLARLELVRGHRDAVFSPAAKRAFAGGALAASVAFLVAGRKRAR